MHKPLICQALCRRIPPVPSQPPAEDRGCRIAHRTVGFTERIGHQRAAAGPSVTTHSEVGGTPGAHPERNLPLSIYTVLCFRKNVLQSLQFGGKKLV